MLYYPLESMYKETFSLLFNNNTILLPQYLYSYNLQRDPSEKAKNILNKKYMCIDVFNYTWSYNILLILKS